MLLSMSPVCTVTMKLMSQRTRINAYELCLANPALCDKIASMWLTAASAGVGVLRDKINAMQHFVICACGRLSMVKHNGIVRHATMLM